ncbi:MAG: hypothetical protein ACI9YU_001610 [Flavobacteriales bacterium]|jgi:hypothetical protein
MKIHLAAFAILFALTINTSTAQCGAGEVEISIQFATDNWGYEAYVEIVPQGNGCGNGAIYEGGNTTQLNCNSGGGGTTGATGTNGNGFASNQTITVDNICVLEGTALDLIYVDDYGDGGLQAQIFVDGFQIGTMEGTGAGSIFPFVASLPDALDMTTEEIRTPYSYVQPEPNIIRALITNVGVDAITSLTFNYQIDNGPVEIFAISGLFISNFDSYLAEHSVPWNASEGIHNVKVWASDLNGNSDMNPANDQIERTVEVGPGIPDIMDGYLGLASYDLQEHGSSSDGLDKPTDLDFFPVLTRNELWVINKKTEANGGSTTTFYDAGEGDQTVDTREDGNNWHFMSLPTGIAFGENENFGNSPGVFDANHDGGTPFTGPSLWSSDPAVYAQPSGGNGSHLDMLHESPECQGIAHEVDNVYWVFDGYSNDVVRYDFAEDHGPGHDFHGDAVVHRYSDEAVAPDPQGKIVSHMVLDKETDWLYVVDHGNQRVFRIDINSGTLGGTPAFVGGEPIAVYRYMTGYTQEDVVTTGLVKPAGIDIVANKMIVSDYETSDIIIYDISTMPAVELGRINTGAIGIMGVKIGPDGRIWYVDYDGNKVYKVEDQGVGVNEEASITSGIYPNPNNGSELTISVSAWDNAQFEILDIAGRTVQTGSLSNSINRVSTNLNGGAYVVRVNSEGVRQDHRLIVH